MPNETTKQENPSSKPVLYFHHAGLTHTGLLREHNEDDYTLPTTTDAAILIEKGYLYVLADGMGGHQKGEVASAVTVQAVPAEYYATVPSLEEENSEEAVIDALSNAIAKANIKVMEATEGGGTTVVTAVLYEDRLVIMNVGDSRAYLLRDDELHLLSRDHSLVSRLVEMGKITEEEALSHPRRNVLYQALGQGPDLEIHVYTEKVQLNDTIILCSDGLWGEISPERLKQVMHAAESPQAAVNQLVDMANAAGGPDNITAIIIHISDQAPATSPEAESPKVDDTQPSIAVQPSNSDTLPGSN